MTRTVDGWRNLMADKTTEEIAELILGDLLGYRSENKHRSDDVESLCNLLRILRNATPKPVTPDENIGSCEPGPLIRWDKTQQTWHTDVDGVGLYSVRRTGKHMPFGAYLNGKPLAVECHKDVSVVKRAVELRIVEARRISKKT